MKVMQNLGRFNNKQTIHTSLHHHLYENPKITYSQATAGFHLKEIARFAKVKRLRIQSL
jgi:uncharacterized protein YpbB